MVQVMWLCSRPNRPIQDLINPINTALENMGLSAVEGRVYVHALRHETTTTIDQLQLWTPVYEELREMAEK